MLVSNVGKCVDDRGLAWEQPTTAPGAAGRSASASRSGGRRAEPSCQRCPPASAGAQGSGPGLLRVRSLRDLAAGLSFTRLAPAAWRGVLAAALVAAGGLALAEPALGQAEVELLNTTLTPVNIPVFGTQNTAVGCGPTAGLPEYCGTIMTDHDFTEAGVTYSIHSLRDRSIVFPDDPSSNYNVLSLSITPKLSTRLKSMTLHVDGASFAFGGTVADDGPSLDGKSWRNPGLTWTADTPVTIRLTRANVAPTAANGEVVTPTNSAYTFTASDFRFSDVDEEHGQSLQGVRIVTLPASGKGTLTLGGTAVTADESVARSDIDGGRLKYTPPADEYGNDLASFTFKVSDGTAESSAANTMTVTVTAPLVSLSPDVLVVAEGAGAAVVTVSLDRPCAESALSVLWLTQDGTAEAPNDYTAGEGPLTFAAGESRKEISVPIVDDAVRENPAHGTHESFFVFLDPGQGYRLSDSSITIVEIADNDGDAPPDLTPPQLTGAAVNGSTLVLTYDETLDGASIPARGDFVVTARPEGQSRDHPGQGEIRPGDRRARVPRRGCGERRHRRLRLSRVPRAFRVLPAARRDHDRQADPRERLRHQGDRAAEPALYRVAEAQPRLGRHRQPARNEPFHGAAHFLLLRRGHRYLPRLGSVHRHDRADEHPRWLEHP